MRIERTVILPTTPEDAWAVLVDWERQAAWMLDADRVKVVSATRQGVGVRLAVRTKLLAAVAFTEPIEVVGWDPPVRLEIRHGGALVGTGAWSLEPTGGATRLRWLEDVRLRVPIVGELAARSYGPVLRRLMAGSLASLRRDVIARGPVPPLR